MKHLFIAIVLFINCGACYAAPDISLVNTTGTTIHIEGTGFGTNTSVGTSELQFLSDNIENGTDGAVFSAVGWGVDTDHETSTQAVPRYSSVRAHSGNKSIVLDYLKNSDGEINRYRGNFYYNHVTGINRIYISFWVRAERIDPDGTGQWKIWRIINSTSFIDAGLDFMQNCFHPNLADGSRAASLHTEPQQSSWDCNGCINEPSTPAIFLSADEVPGPSAVHDRWVRMEYWIDVGTLDNYDGTFVYKFHDIDNPSGAIIKDVPKLTFNGNLNILKTGDAEIWYAVIFGGAAVDGLDVLTYWDDVFIQVGSWARVEIGNASTWSACTHREVIKPTAWSDTSIAAIADDSVFSHDDNLYLFVVDNDGAVSNGYPISLSEGGTPIGGNSQLSNIGTGASHVVFRGYAYDLDKDGYPDSLMFGNYGGNYFIMEDKDSYNVSIAGRVYEIPK